MMLYNITGKDQESRGIWMMRRYVDVMRNRNRKLMNTISSETRSKHGGILINKTEIKLKSDNLRSVKSYR